MLDPRTLQVLRTQIAACIAEDRMLLDQLVEDVRPLETTQHRIQPRSTTSVSMVGTDGGNNRLRFDPFLVQIVRIVDSSRNELWLEVVTPTTALAEIDARHFHSGRAKSPLGRMMTALGVGSVADLSPMIREGTPARPRSPAWTGVYRELTEWAVLLDLAHKDYGSDTLIVFDGLLRSKVFKGTLFRDYGQLLAAAVERQKQRRRNIYILGVAKHSAVLARYRLALKLRHILRENTSAFVRIPREVEKKAYVWSEYARGQRDEQEGGEPAKFVNGVMFFVKFGNRPHDAVWPVDVFEPQTEQAAAAFGYLVHDAREGFPIPLYPRSLQKAHEAAALLGLDMDLLQDVVTGSIRGVLGANAHAVDEFALEPSDPSRV
ncbi:MAG: hypothetical protein ACREC6_00215 [Hyphomicrobiaceae bacterium]